MATITAFRTALSTPKEWFCNLATAQWDGAEVRRSTLFAEARISLGGAQGLALMPLSSLSLRRIEQLLPRKLHMSSEIIPRFEIMRDEMRHTLSDGSLALCDILFEPLPDALPLTDALNTLTGEHEANALLKAIGALREELRRADISHNNLREENILIDHSGRLYPIRWYYATAGSGGDEEALDRLCSKIASSSNGMLMRDTDTTPYATTPAPIGDYMAVGRFSEGLMAVEVNSGWGYINSDNQFVIEPKYLWVNDFREGRAEVECAEGMGLINKRGEYIIPPTYRIVEYDPTSGLSQVYNGEEWLEFDYEGHIVGEPITTEESKEIEYYN